MVNYNLISQDIPVFNKKIETDKTALAVNEALNNYLFKEKG